MEKLREKVRELQELALDMIVNEKHTHLCEKTDELGDIVLEYNLKGILFIDVDLKYGQASIHIPPIDLIEDELDTFGVRDVKKVRMQSLLEKQDELLSKQKQLSEELEKINNKISEL